MIIDSIVRISAFLIVFAVAIRAGAAVYSLAVSKVRLSRESSHKFNNLMKVAVNHPRTVNERDEIFPKTWAGRRKFRVVRRVYENLSKSICSFYLIPYDNQPLADYKPGQFLAFGFPAGDMNEEQRRCYSLSEAPSEKRFYRVTIKKQEHISEEGASYGLFSSYFHDHLFEGDIVEAYAPSGGFVLNEVSNRPVVFIAGGVGITPLISMVNALILARSRREVLFVYSTTDRQEHAMYNHLQWIKRNCPNIKVVIFYSQPDIQSRIGVDYDFRGRVDLQSIAPMLKRRDYEFYLCGPDPMVEKLASALQNWGVPEREIRRESFSGSKASIRVHTENQERKSKSAVSRTYEIEFQRSGKKALWKESAGSLLEFAEEVGVKVPYNCRSGNCGSCKTSLISGEVTYPVPPTFVTSNDDCLPCVCNPSSNMVLDL